MKIGVFGDSFAEHRARDIWWKYLEIDYGHEIECFGEGGSSIVFSAKKILEKFRNYELIIWCVTDSRRITVWHRANYKEIEVHVTGRHHKVHPDPEIQLKINATEQYLLEAWDAPDGEFVSECIIEYVKTKVPNILFVPCFGPPIYNDINQSKFDLITLCQRETNFYFPNVELADLYDNYTDLRPGHFTDITHKTLASQIAESLRPGVFISDYESFPAPTAPKDQIFRKRT